MPLVLLVAPAGRNVGLTTVCLGLLRALDRVGVRAAFAKPLTSRGDDHSLTLVKLGAHLDPPAPIERAKAEALLAVNDDQTLMEHVVALCATAGEGADVLVVEGMVPESGMVYSSRVNALMLKALDAELILVASPRDETPSQAAAAVAIAARGYGAPDPERTVACILNRVAAPPSATAKAEEPISCELHSTCRRTAAAQSGLDHLGLLCGRCADAPLDEEQLKAFRVAVEAEDLRPVAVVPYRHDLAAPRIKDLAQAIEAKIVRKGDFDSRRIRNVCLCATAASDAMKAFKPGLLVITPGDRADIVASASLAAAGGVPLAGLLLTGGICPDEAVLQMCEPGLSTGLPVLSVTDGSYPIATRIGLMNTQIAPDDAERIEATMNGVADCVDPDWLKGLTAKTGREPRVSPPAFRHQLVEAARAANKRIVLPEGNEPRTIAAAAIAQERGIARCVLMGNPDEIGSIARKQGIRLPSSIEILDAAKAAPKYIDPLVAFRKKKGMTPEMAKSELEDTIMIGTMMMALDEADGLVSGAVHTTAHTIRPALQVIKTAPGCSLVSSIFFMCLPDQVLVFGDCAVNPNPTAEQLADIAIQSADSAKAFGIPARVAMLSYSTGTSGAGDEVNKVKTATDIARKARPDLAIDGPLQYDAAIMPDVARSKAPKSPVAGKATVFVFPDLNTGNVTYKAVQRSANVVSIGPMLQGLAKPVNDLSRGCLVEDIVFTIALTAIQAKQAGDRAAKKS